MSSPTHTPDLRGPNFPLDRGCRGMRGPKGCCNEDYTEMLELNRQAGIHNAQYLAAADWHRQLSGDQPAEDDPTSIPYQDLPALSEEIWHATLRHSDATLS